VARSPAQDNLHSRIVVILKVTLPLLALAILSSLFLFSRPIDPEDAIPYADRLAQPRMTGAGFSTVTSDGATLTLSAYQAAPTESGATAKGLSGQWSAPGGGKTEFSATSGRLDRNTDQLVLEDGVRLATSTGYVVTMDQLTIRTDTSFMESNGAVAVTAPMGDLTAGGMRSERSADGTSHLLVFNRGVRLIYQPNP
jgi:lipopolysaccharide export system protein LptC